MSDDIEKGGIRHVGAELCAGEFAFTWLVRQCCLCLGRHVHGGGALNGDPREFLGSRTAHCQHQPPNHPGVYVLADINPKRSAAIIQQHQQPQRAA